MDKKIETLKRLIAADRTELESTNARIKSLQAAVQSNGGLSTVERLLFANQIGLAVQEQRQVITDQTQNEQLLTLAQTVEQQVERLAGHARQQGWDVPPDQIVRDDGYSGASLRRPIRV